MNNENSVVSISHEEFRNRLKEHRMWERGASDTREYQVKNTKLLGYIQSESLSNISFSNSIISRSALTGNLSNATFENCIFDAVNMENANLEGAWIKNCEFEAINYDFVKLSSNDLQNARVNEDTVICFENLTDKDIPYLGKVFEGIRGDCDVVVGENIYKLQSIVELHKANEKEVMNLNAARNEQQKYKFETTGNIEKNNRDIEDER